MLFRNLLTVSLILIGAPVFARDREDPYQAFGEVIKNINRTINDKECTLAVTTDFETFRNKTDVFREAFLIRDNSVDFYKQRAKQFLVYILSKHIAELVTEGFYRGKEARTQNGSCNFSISVDYVDKFGQDKNFKNLLTWKFTKALSNKVNWDKLDARTFNEVALEYTISNRVEEWYADEPQIKLDAAPSKQPKDQAEQPCSMFLFNANAIFIRATTFCRKDYMDTRAGYKALEGSKACSASMAESEMKHQAMQAMQRLDQIVRQKGARFGCAMVEGIERRIDEGAH